MSRQSTGRASYADRIAMRRELVLSVVRRRPGLTIREIAEETYPQAWIGSVGGDLDQLKRGNLVEPIHITSRTVLWRPFIDREPLLWEGDDG
jgi:hypothetical protein